MEAVSQDTRNKLMNIQPIATNRPAGLRGAKSPYPTVVIVTALHQRAEPMPRLALPSPPNSFGLLLCSSTQMRIATNTSEAKSAATTRQKSHTRTRSAHDQSRPGPGAVLTATPSPER